GMPTAALAALVIGVGWLGYPATVIGIAEAGGPDVPVVSLALLGCVQAGIALAVRRPVTAWLQRPGLWAAIVRVNTVAMTMYLWHVTVLVLVVGGLALTGAWWSVAPLSTAWWLTRPLWLAALLMLLVPVAVVMAPIEHRVPPARPRAAGSIATAAMVAATGAASGAIALLVGGGVLGLSGIAGAATLTAAARHAGAFGTPAR
ncbi:MAG: hypothetical protein KY460_16060, partial [Actinobacteria bacterium]|nr:hypothetical protein [Actinomycetota bacterium]